VQRDGNARTASIAARSRASRPRACPSALTILAPTLVTPQPRFDAHGCLIGACMGIRRERVGFEHDARVEMNHALGAETEPLPADGDVPGKSAVEIFGHGLRDAHIDALAQRFADVDVLARDAKWHDRPPTTARTIPAAHMSWLAPRVHVCARSGGPQFAAESGSAQYHRSCVRRPRPGTSVSPADAAPTKQFASPRDILRPFAERCRFPPRAAFPRWYRRTALALDFQRRSAA